MVYAPKWGSRYSTILLKYLEQSWQTLRLLVRVKPRIIFVMTPPVFACLPIWFYVQLSGARYVIDAHSGAFLDPRWSPILFVHRFFSRWAATTIVTNDYLEEIVRSWGAKAFVISDLPIVFPPPARMSLGGSFKITLVNTFTRDEPLELFLQAARELPNVQFYVTGLLRDADKRLLNMRPDNVEFTDFLPAAQYVGLLMASDAVMALTTFDHTMQRGAYEAVYLAKPVLVTGTEFLRRAFYKGTVHVENTVEGIVRAVNEMKLNLQKYQKEVESLRCERLQRWNRTQTALRQWLEGKVTEPVNESWEPGETHESFQ
jgi:glycosyltransferase involved in cell wall biosynthesis